MRRIAPSKVANLSVQLHGPADPHFSDSSSASWSSEHPSHLLAAPHPSCQPAVGCDTQRRRGSRSCASPPPKAPCQPEKQGEQD